MDGNGRWARRRHLPRAIGHKRGVDAVRALLRGVRQTRLEALTLFAFSSENWRRPQDEISDLTTLLKHFIRADLDELAADGVRLKVLGDYHAFDSEAVTLVEDAVDRTCRNTGTTLAIALNYGAQQEIARAARAAAAEGEVTQASIARHLDTADMPPLDLLIRTSGEVRLSNFLLWQAAYAELCFLDVLWPDFTMQHLQAAMDQFASRERRYGGR
ncbi:polyprenyl diphosphate synthase [Croceicoccus sp. F390]|uniref:Isoprenyl transferase n=1 Tax=Croceicoccus esteveae TaxID=3075597 RepID=A0ABU2ZLW1_9SPHN|nr:polyprenyl diphosphate synthase [Croceicoccus sp. F390]MDT0576569.1 polyprenyl diphosphate synthase [Croceicoccus sp. F390]